MRTVKYKITVPDAEGKPVKYKGRRQLAAGETLTLDVCLPPKPQKPVDEPPPAPPQI